MAKNKKILIIHPVGDPQQMPTVRGICEYARQRGSWVVQSNPEVYRLRQRDLAAWPGDGVIALLRTGADVRAACALGRRSPWYQWAAALETWLRTLQPPFGLMAVHDYAATVVIDACLRIGLRVPQDVAVIGVGDDWIACECCEVPLTSIARSNREVGYRAAALLDRLMAGRRAPKSGILIPPEGVVKRRSTDMMAIENPKVATAIKFVREHLSEPFGVEAVSHHTGLSRRTLDIHFRQCLLLLRRVTAICSE